MPAAFKTVVVLLGVIFFLAHLGWAISKVRFYTSRDDKLEAAGTAIPGLAGPLAAAAVLLSPSVMSLIPCLLMILVILPFGRAIYELVVFRRRGGGTRKD